MSFLCQRRFVTLAIIMATAGVILISGCTQLAYYAQAAHGQFSLLANARPINAWLAELPPDALLHQQLIQVQQIRRFAATQLGLPDTKSYTSYTQLKQPFVIWNVVATGPLSLTLKQWCFPIAGCVTYRGYFNQQAAQHYAEELRGTGLDVQVSGVPAYSTLGWFSDPVLSSFIHYPTGELARLVFHELAHQVVYLKDDTQFNESFATAVEEIGVQRWLASQDNCRLQKSYQQSQGRKNDFLALLLISRANLGENFQRPVSEISKLQRKQEIFNQLKADYQLLKQSWGGYSGYDRWFAEPLSNAHLGAVATYHDFVPAFRVLFDQEKSLSGFYDAAIRLSKLDKNARQEEFFKLSQSVRPIVADALVLPVNLTKIKCPGSSCSIDCSIEKSSR